MKYLLTGATGFLGGAVARQLRGAGHELRALVRDSQRAKQLRELGIDLCVGDVTHKESLRLAMQGADGVFHIAGWYKVGARDTSEAEAVNVDGTRNVLEVMRELGIRKGVYTSSLAVNSDTHGRIVDESYHYTGSHLSEYDRTKAAAHALAEEMAAEGLPLVIVMPGVTYGPGDPSSLGQTFAAFLQGRLPMIPRGTAVCWTHVEDAARGHILAMELGKAGESYIIAGDPATMEQAFEIASDITGIPVPRRMSPGPLRAMAALMRIVERLVPVPLLLSSEALRISAGVTYVGDHTKAQRELGLTWRPLREGLEEILPGKPDRSLGK